MKDESQLVLQHYGFDHLLERIIRSCSAAGHDIGNPTIEMFQFFDQLHGGGINSTRALAKTAGVTNGMRVLDAGCGIGGSSRYLAKIYGCRVEAIDLTPQYVDVAKRLDELCGLNEMIVVREASVIDLPYDDNSFDLVWCQNVTMNIKNKQRMFSEALRVLVPGGRYALTHVAQGPKGEPYYPLPWARTPSYSFIDPPENILTFLKKVGFINATTRMQTARPDPSQTQTGNEMGQSVVMGDDMQERQINAVRSAQEGKLINMMVVAERPTSCSVADRG